MKVAAIFLRDAILGTTPGESNATAGVHTASWRTEGCSEREREAQSSIVSMDRAGWDEEQRDRAVYGATNVTNSLARVEERIYVPVSLCPVAFRVSLGTSNPGVLSLRWSSR